MITINLVVEDTFSITCICGDEIYCQELGGELFWECLPCEQFGWLAFDDFQ
jgi:hypothetical protein